jgi:hypothetical protein
MTMAFEDLDCSAKDTSGVDPGAVRDPEAKMAERPRRPRAQAQRSAGGPRWPTIETLGLSPEAQRMRVRSIGGSDANIILSGSPERVLQLWREKRGEEAPEDLSANIAVMLGCWSE